MGVRVARKWNSNPLCEEILRENTPGKGQLRGKCEDLGPNEDSDFYNDRFSKVIPGSLISLIEQDPEMPKDDSSR